MLLLAACLLFSHPPLVDQAQLWHCRLDMHQARTSNRLQMYRTKHKTACLLFLPAPPLLFTWRNSSSCLEELALLCVQNGCIANHGCALMPSVTGGTTPLPQCTWLVWALWCTKNQVSCLSSLINMTEICWPASSRKRWADFS